MQEADIEGLEKERVIDRCKKTMASAVAYIIPLLMSTPTVYAGLMTLPLLTYIGIVVGGLPASEEAVFYLLFEGNLLETVVLLLGMAFFLYSVVFLWRKKSKGLVTSGPYLVVRHPQYLSLIIFTSALTSRSVWLLLNTDGIGILEPRETVAAWFLMVFVYMGLALFEESHLASLYQEEWREYRRQVGLLLPLVSSRRRWLEIAASIVVLGGFMLGLLLSSESIWLL
ncbi:MAG: hypothetical protein EAX81_08560 [Candidatus Thorarchaeota archaeon]|nr:hypothetical protein [Candidatus Thorarchaeota archaeon]